jgi:hypothetical protein
VRNAIFCELVIFDASASHITVLGDTLAVQ